MSLEDRFHAIARTSRSGIRIATLGELVDGCPAPLAAVEVEQRDGGFTAHARHVRSSEVTDGWWIELESELDRWLGGDPTRSELMLLALTVVGLPWSSRKRAIRQRLQERAFGARNSNLE